MKRFQFNLEPVLSLRKKKEDEKLKSFSLVAGEINQIRNSIRENEKQIEFLTEDSDSLRGASLRDYQLHQGYIRSLITRNENLESNIEDKKPELDAKRAELILAQKDRKILEILKENQYKVYKKLYFKKEKFELEEHYNQLKSIQWRKNHASFEPEPTPRIFTYDTGSRTENDDSGASEIKKLYDKYKK
ncbi:flagellar export protein FliJ [Leptospira borgpetersenii]|uniref:flagellar export protein FliJ n=1 Tax=Leptospira borgpetersenii TaxID=174 RepID=UPI00077307C0|nr:flagellar export protein FliJ [Leptospira borgpetersenii]MBE8363601.1 flagellar export protein FliJ [Leptospira borgpetersenii serovar Balcanica]MBE8368566.1 flagellar export protein FliJ [Leptospira borgpetersenii serovar Balcanica]MBE8399724.1 flagellar export protein FliJ [Leptospira borgpetersenii serovar Tarassovi]MBE8402836.1 flagellar export protein FliJ [Leptospira borgpetersenii serovar Tarassovi]MBE8405888.1 flagellar export protein FliJ [Leptospira borgpetersenii serovar Tarassov